MLKKIFNFLMIFYSITNQYLVESCSCAKFTYRPYMERIKYLVRLPDSTILNRLALIGTHWSLSYNAEEERFRAQDLNIVQQLKYGIRVFDIRVQLRPELFKIELNYVSVNTDFRELLYDFDKFLDDNPGEFIIMFIYQTRTAVPKVKEKTCEVIDYYIDNIWGGWRMVKDWKLSDSIGMYRNRILLASLDTSFAGCTFNINGKCRIDNQNKMLAINSNFNVNDMRRHIFNAIGMSFRKSPKCYINNISFSDNINTRRVIAKDGGYYFRDACPRPLNDFMVEKFQNPKRALIIVLADYVTQELIDKINYSNFPKSVTRGWEG